MRTLAILPVKSFSQAKQRLSHELAPAVREALAEAMLEDVLESLARCAGLDGLLVVSPGYRARELAEQAGASTISDEEHGHNDAAGLGISAALEHGAERVLLVPGDCPALDPSELDELLSRPAASPGVVIVPDRHGTGTNALLLTPPRVMRPSFGPGSCERHRQLAAEAGAEVEIVHLRSLALDVDTPEDLETLAELAGRAPRTLALLSRC